MYFPSFAFGFLLLFGDCLAWRIVALLRIRPTPLRLDTDKLAEAKQILSELGMNFSEAVNIFTSLIVANQGLPFDVALPNDETKAALMDVRAKRNLQITTLEQLEQEIGY